MQHACYNQVTGVATKPACYSHVTVLSHSCSSNMHLAVHVHVGYYCCALLPCAISMMLHVRYCCILWPCAVSMMLSVHVWVRNIFHLSIFTVFLFLEPIHWLRS